MRTYYSYTDCLITYELCHPSSFPIGMDVLKIGDGQSDISRCSASELSADALERHMRAIVDGGLSSRTGNFDRQDDVTFMSRCVRTGRFESNPLKVVPKLNERRDRRRVRRPLSDVEPAPIPGRGEAPWPQGVVSRGRSGRTPAGRLETADVNFAEGSITIANGKATMAGKRHPNRLARGRIIGYDRMNNDNEGNRNRVASTSAGEAGRVE